MLKSLWVLTLGLLLAACNPMEKLATPKVRLVDIKFLESRGFEQRFLVGLMVENPNKVALPVEGLDYKIAINGQDVFRGLRGEIPTIAARGETYIEIPVSANLVSAAGVLASLLTDTRPALDYDLDANFDLKGVLPDFHIRERGQVNLAQ